MIKRHFFSFFIGIILSSVFLGFTAQNIKAQGACYDGNWVQPTCDPTTSDPGSCNILPPLFSGVLCDQHTGYLRIDSYTGQASEKTYLKPGLIQVGNIIGGWSEPVGSIAAYGPLISGNFSSVPTWAGGGDIAAYSDISARERLYIGGTSSFNNNLTVNNSILSVLRGYAIITSRPRDGESAVSISTLSGQGAPTVLSLTQAAGERGDILVLNTADKNNIRVNNFGYFISDLDFQIKTGEKSNFRIVNFNDSAILNLNSSGRLTVGTSIYENPGRIETYGEIVARGITSYNSLNQPFGAIRGDYLATNGTSCSSLTTSTVLFFDKVSNQWVCRVPSAMGVNVNLLQVLQAGADASDFTGTPKIGHGTTAGGVFVTGNGAPGTLTIQYKSSSQSNTGDQIGQIGFATSYNDLDEAKIVVVRGAPGSGGDYPTNMSFWTTPDGSTVAQERMTILHNGNIGIATNAPNEKFEVYDNTAGTARIRITDLTQNPELQLQYNVGANDHWGIYNNQSDDSLRFWGGGSDRIIITQTGLVGLGINPVNAKLQVNPTTDIEGLRVISSNFSPLVVRNSGDSADLFRVNQSGYVGINTTPSGGRLHIAGTFADGWDSGLRLTRIGYNGDFRINVVNTDTYFRNFNAGQNFEFRNSSDQNIFKIYAASPYAVTGNFAAYNGTSCTNGQVLVKDSSNRWVCSSSGSLATPGGSDGQIQYNNGGVLGGASSLIYDDTTNRIGINNTSPSARLDVTGTIRGTFVGSSGALCASGQVLVFDGTSWNCSSVAGGSDNLGNHIATQNLDMNGYSIVNANSGTFSGTVSANKITVNTIDPVYTIKGERYATYVPTMTGVKEETTGLLKLQMDKTSGLVSGKINFSSLEKGSDLWLFAQTINYQENFGKIVILLTPAFDGRVWYEKDIKNKILKIYGKPINNLAKDFEVSYRLTGPRFDYQQWSNTVDEEAEGLNIDKFLQNK